MTRTARLRAYAKLNLGLRVLYKRPDGYHELRTVFQTISLADRLEVEFTPAPQTRIEILGTPEIADNLVEKAARLVLETVSVQGHVLFRLKKNIPSGAGLGGGSSDAAAVLLALPVLAGVRIEAGRLAEIAGRLGSDVPYFLYGGTALGLGRGEELYPLPERPATRALLVAPAIHSSTAEAYRDLSPTLTSIRLQNKLNGFQQHLWAGAGPSRAAGSDGNGSYSNHDDNDFEAVVCARHPGIAEVRDRLIALGAAQAMMTGSGSAVFGVFEDPSKLSVAKSSCQALFPDARVFEVSFVSRTRYRAAWKRFLKPHLAQSVSAEKSSNPDPWPPQSRYAQ